MVDTDGRLLAASVAPASQHDSHGGVGLLQAARKAWPTLQRCFADSAYAGPRVAIATAVAVEVVSAAPGQKGFAVQPRRWVVEAHLHPRRAMPQTGARSRSNPRCSTRLLCPRQRYAARPPNGTGVMKRVLTSCPTYLRLFARCYSQCLPSYLCLLQEIKVQQAFAEPADELADAKEPGFDFCFAIS